MSTVTKDLRRSAMDLPAEVTGSAHVFRRIRDNERKPLTITVDESKLSRAGADVESRKEALRELQERKASLEASKEPLREEYQRLATLNALGESALADVDRAKARLAAVEKELQSLSDTDSELCGQIELAQNVLNELQARRAAAIETERQRVLQVESETIRANLATMLAEARKLDELTTVTAVKFNEIAGAGLARTNISEFPSFEAIVNAYFHRFELYLPEEGGANG